jgi:DNA-binding MarR family transcriptional regulator
MKTKTVAKVTQVAQIGRDRAGELACPGEITRLRLAILRLARRIRQNAISELSPSQQSIVAILDRYGPLRPGRLAELEAVQPPSITRVIRNLEELGLVTRQSVRGNLRQVEVKLTERGKLAAGRVHSRRDEWLASVVERLPSGQRLDLDDVVVVLERLLKECSPDLERP